MASLADASGLPAIEVDNRLLGAEARKSGIDDAVRGAFDGACGEWRITVSEIRHFSPPWWWLSAQGDHEILEVCFPPSEQHPDLVRERLVEALRGRNLLP